VIAYVGARLKTVDALTRRRHVIVPFVGVDPTWSPDGRRVAFGTIGGSTLSVVVANVAGSGWRLVTPPLGRELYRIDVFGISWSPDGRRLAFWLGSWREGSYPYVMQADGASLRKLTVRGADLTWSPTGDRIAFIGNRALWTATAEGTNLHRLVAGVSERSAPQWSPDGRTIAYARVDGIWLIAARGGRPRLAVKVDEPSELAWSHR